MNTCPFRDSDGDCLQLHGDIPLVKCYRQDYRIPGGSCHRYKHIEEVHTAIDEWSVFWEAVFSGYKAYSVGGWVYEPNKDV